MSSQPLGLAAIVAMSLVFAAHCSPVSAAGDALTKGQADKLTQVVVPAYHNGESLGVLKGLSPLLAKMKPGAMREADALLKKNGVPPVARLLSEARLASVRQGTARKMPKAHKSEILLVLPVFHQRVANVLKQVRKHPAWKEPPGQAPSLDDYRQLLDDLEVLDSMLESAEDVALYAARMGKVVSRLRIDNLPKSQQEAIAFDFSAARKKLEGLRDHIRERDIELRITRLARAADILETSDDGPARWEAAYAVSGDHEFLEAFFKDFGRNRRGKFTRPRLNDPDLKDAVEANYKRAKQSAGDLLEKSRLLFDGLAWWLRGRYGRGTHGGGLLKDAAVLSNPLAQLTLLMPHKPPRPTPPADRNGRSTPDCDRRHHYTWAWENRGTRSNQDPHEVFS